MKYEATSQEHMAFGSWYYESSTYASSEPDPLSCF